MICLGLPAGCGRQTAFQGPRSLLQRQGAGGPRIGPVTLEGDSLERIDLQLDTSDAAFAKVHPQNPTGSFEIPSRDDETTFEVKFTQDKKAPRKVVKKSGPVPM